MAYIGMKNVLLAKLKTETKGQPCVYENGMVFGKAINADVSFTKAQTDLYADDGAAESDNSITGGSVTLGIDDIPDEALTMLGYKKVGEGTDAEYIKTSESSDYVGLGFTRTRVLKGERSHEAIWLYKLQLGLESLNAQTKGQQMQWQTPTLSGTLMSVQNDADLTTNWHAFKRFENEADAVNYLKSLAGMAVA